MEIFKLFGSIFVDSDDANKSISKTEEKAEGLGAKLGKAIETAAKWSIAIGAAAGAVAVKLGKEVISAFGGYEQLVGGVDTLFKESSEKLQAYAADAYKTAGLSANNYMETVTGFSASLIQSLGGDTEKAVEYANMAITDMSDNANKMGTDMASIQNAYQGFAKQNYTMLDNLKLGYGGTKAEMERLLADATAISGITYDVSSYADVVDAIHIIQESLGIAGTTALEAEETIEGSLNAFRAAIGNMIVGFGNADSDMQKLTNNVVDAFKSVVKNIAPVIKNIANALPEALGAMFPIIGSLLPELLGTVANLFQQVLDTILKILPELIPVAVGALRIIVDTLINNLPLLIDAAITLIMTLSEGLIDALPQLIPAVIAMIVLLATELIKRIPQILEFVPQLFTNLVKAFSEIDWASLGSDLMRGIVNGILNLKDWVVEKVKEVAGSIAKGFTDFFKISSPSKLMEGYGENLDEGLAQGVEKKAFKPIDAIKSVAEKIGQVIDTTVNKMSDFVAVSDNLKSRIDNFDKQRSSGGGSSSNYQEQRENFYEANKSEIDAISKRQGVDLGVAQDMLRENLKSDIPKYAEGTDFHPGGWALVGEKGPEIAKLPRGTEVISNEESKEMFKQRQLVINLNIGNYIGDDYSLKQLERKLRDIRILEDNRLGMVSS